MHQASTETHLHYCLTCNLVEITVLRVNLKQQLIMNLSQKLDWLRTTCHSNEHG